mmetsp:Transcript_44077/g.134185  ORF Transcript_44077/g.134185 Transcript_44077/m.134185 type:complete len:254 (-) Transcript_44077:1571-2332(-)
MCTTKHISSPDTYVQKICNSKVVAQENLAVQQYIFASATHLRKSVKGLIVAVALVLVADGPPGRRLMPERQREPIQGEPPTVHSPGGCGRRLVRGDRSATQPPEYIRAARVLIVVVGEGAPSMPPTTARDGGEELPPEMRVAEGTMGDGPGVAGEPAISYLGFPEAKHCFPLDGSDGYGLMHHAVRVHVRSRGPLGPSHREHPPDTGHLGATPFAPYRPVHAPLPHDLPQQESKTLNGTARLQQIDPIEVRER